MLKRILLILFLCTVVMVPDAFAAGEDSIFYKLADRAKAIGLGLRGAGFMIAGFGLIVFAFMAIFNKISWKSLAYIMLSCFILSLMFGVIAYISEGSSSFNKYKGDLKYDVHGDMAQGGAIDSIWNTIWDILSNKITR
jgi:hypothetical protein